MAASAGASGAHKSVLDIKSGASSAWKNTVGAWVGAGGVWKQWFGGVFGFSATLTPGTSGGNTGYSLIMGSITNSTLAPGRTIVAVADAGGASLVFSVIGFGSDPGATYITEVIIAGTSFDASLAGYSYSGGQATWTWGLPFGFSVGVPVLVEVP